MTPQGTDKPRMQNIPQDNWFAQPVSAEGGEKRKDCPRWKGS